MRNVGKRLLMLQCVLLPLLYCNHTVAQKSDADQIFAKYRSEQAVITNVKEQLVIKNEKGRLVASSNVSTEKMLIGDLSPGLYNKEYIFHSYFSKLEDHDEEALIPGKNGYVRQRDPSSKTVRSEDEDIFYDDSKQTEISFTGLTPRSLLRSNYTLSHTDLHMLPAFYFQENLPVVQSTYEVVAPKYVKMKFVIKGYHADQIKQSTQENKNTITYSFTTSNMSAFKDYDDVPSTSWYALHIVPYIASYELPGEPQTQMLSDPEHLYTYLYKFIRDVNVKDDDELIRTVAAIIKNDKTQRDKAAHIYEWVQQNIHYIAFEDSLEGFIPRQASTICKRKFGDCKDMASILSAMCRMAGINAYLTWIGTRSKPYTYEETPLPRVANHMICTIRIGDEWIFLDGTHPLIPFGKVPSTIQGKEAMVAINEKEYKILMVPETEAKYNVTSDSTYLRINDRQASGKTVLYLHGYPSWELQVHMMYNKNDDRDKLARSVLSCGSNKYFQKSYEYSPSDTGNKNCKLSADFTLDDYVQKVGKEYYVNMNLKLYFDGSNIDTEGRQVSVYFKYKDIMRNVVVLDVPVGYHVSYLPPQASGTLKDRWSYKIKYVATGNKIFLTREYEMISMSVPASDFAQHNKMVDDLKKQYKESVVLTAD